MSLEGRIAVLEANMPRAYMTYDREGKPVIQSELHASRWYTWAMTLLKGHGRDAVKAALREQLARSVGCDNCGGHLYEMLRIFDAGPIDCSKNPRLEEGETD